MPKNADLSKVPDIDRLKWSSESLRIAATAAKGSRLAKAILGEIAARCSWGDPLSSKVRRTAGQLAEATDATVRSVRRATNALIVDGYLEAETVREFSPTYGKYVDKVNEYRLTPLMFVEAARRKLTQSLKNRPEGDVLAAELTEKLAALDTEIAHLKSQARAKPKRAAVLIGERGSLIKKLRQEKAAAETQWQAVCQLGDANALELASQRLLEASKRLETKLAEPIVLPMYRAACSPGYASKEKRKASEPESPEGVTSDLAEGGENTRERTSFKSSCDSTPFQEGMQVLPKTSPLLNNNINESITRESIPHSREPKPRARRVSSEQAAQELGQVSEALEKLTSVQVFSRFAAAHSLAEESERGQKRFAKTLAERAKESGLSLDTALTLIGDALTLIECVPPLKAARQDGAAHSLGRLFHKEDLEKVAEQHRYQALRYVENLCKSRFNGETTSFQAIVELSIRQGWEPVLTYDWLSEAPADAKMSQDILAYAKVFRSRLTGQKLERIEENPKEIKPISSFELKALEAKAERVEEAFKDLACDKENSLEKEPTHVSETRSNAGHIVLRPFASSKAQGEKIQEKPLQGDKKPNGQTTLLSLISAKEPETLEEYREAIDAYYKRMARKHRQMTLYATFLREVDPLIKDLETAKTVFKRFCQNE